MRSSDFCWTSHPDIFTCNVRRSPLAAPWRGLLISFWLLLILVHARKTSIRSTSDSDLNLLASKGAEASTDPMLRAVTTEGWALQTDREYRLSPELKP